MGLLRKLLQRQLDKREFGGKGLIARYRDRVRRREGYELGHYKFKGGKRGGDRVR